MGVNKLNRVSTGDEYSADDVNQAVDAITNDFTPRNSDGTVASGAGNIGTAAYPWDTGYFNTLLVGGKEISSGGGGGGTNPGGGGGSIAPSAAVQTGVVSGLSPAGHPNECGWLNQQGSSGVAIEASTANPFVVKLRGVTYRFESRITGGTLPSGYSQAITLPTTTGSWAQEEPQANSRAKYRYGTGGEFPYDNNNANSEVVPASYGDILIIKSSGGGRSTTYTTAIRTSENTSGRRNMAKMAIGAGMNTSPSAFTHPDYNLAWNTTHRVIRAGYLFIDPTVTGGSLTISKRVIGASDVDIPAAADYDTGDVIYIESQDSFFRNNGSSFIRTNFVYCGLLAIDGGSVEAVRGAQTEDALATLLDKKLNILGDPISREGVLRDGKIYFGGDTEGDLEVKTLAELDGQSFRKTGTTAVIDIDNDGTKANNELFCCYFDVNNSDYFYDTNFPAYVVYGGRLILKHPHRYGLYVGSFAVDGSGAVITEAKVGSGSNRKFFNDGRDNVWVTNPHLFGRIKCTEMVLYDSAAGFGRDRRMYIQNRGFGTGSTLVTNVFRDSYIRYFSYNMHSKGDWDKIFYTPLRNDCQNQMRFQTDHSGAIRFEYTQWDEADILHAVGLTAAAREGASASAGGASAEAGGVGGAVGSIDSPQLADASVTHDKIAGNQVGVDNLQWHNDVTAEQFVKIVANTDTEVGTPQYLFETATPSGGGGGGNLTNGSVDYPKFAASAIATEADVYNNPSVNNKIIPNKVLHDVIEEQINEMGALWGSWSTAESTAVSSVSDGQNLAVLGLDDNIAMHNSSNFNVTTASLTAGSMHLCGTSCSGLPALSSGTLRGGFLFIDTDDQRWFYPIDNPESPDSEEFFVLVGASWGARSWNGDHLRTNFHGLVQDGRWSAMAAHAKNSPSSNTFAFETSLSKREENRVYIMRAVYDTSANRFEIYISHQDFEIPLGNMVVQSANIANGAVGSAALGTKAVTREKINTGAVGADQLGNNSVGTAKIANGAITPVQVSYTGTAANDLPLAFDGAGGFKVGSASSGGGGGGSTQAPGNAPEEEFQLASDGMLSWAVNSSSFTIGSIPASSTVSLGAVGARFITPVRNESAFNAQTTNNPMTVIGPDCQGLPSLTGTTLVAGLHITTLQNSSPVRYLIPIAAGTLASNEQVFQSLSGGAWAATGVSNAHFFDSLITASKVSGKRNNMPFITTPLVDGRPSGTGYQEFGVTIKQAASDTVGFFGIAKATPTSVALHQATVSYATAPRTIDAASLKPSSTTNTFLKSSSSGANPTFARIGLTDLPLANEESIFNTDGNNTGLVGNATLAGVLHDVDNETAWDSWSSTTQTNLSSIPVSGTATPGIGGDLTYHNSSSFNIATSAIGATDIVLAGTSCSGLPALASGTRRGFLVFIDSENRRWAITIANPENPDSEDSWEYNSTQGVWISRGYRADELRTSFGTLRANDRFEIFSAIATGGPTSGALSNEVRAARSDGRTRYLIRVNYNTTDNRFEIYTASSEAVYSLQDGEVQTDNIADLAVTNAKLAGSIAPTKIATTGASSSDVLTFDGTNWGPAAASGGSGSNGYSEEIIYEQTTNLPQAQNTHSLSTGKLWSNYSACYYEIKINSSIVPRRSYVLSPRDIFTPDNPTGSLFPGRTSIHRNSSSDTQFQLSSAGVTISSGGYFRVYGIRYMSGVGALTIGGTQAADKVIAATSATAQEWKTVGYTETTIFDGNLTLQNVTHNLTTGESFADYDEIYCQFASGVASRISPYFKSPSSSQRILLVGVTSNDQTLTWVSNTSFKTSYHGSSTPFKVYGRKITLS